LSWARNWVERDIPFRIDERRTAMRKLWILVLPALMLASCDPAKALDFGRLAGQVISGVINNAANQQQQQYAPPQRQYAPPPPAQSRPIPETYTYEEYMARQGALEAREGIDESGLPGDFADDDEYAADADAGQAQAGFDPDNPFAGLAGEEPEDASANAAAGQTQAGFDPDNPFAGLAGEEPEDASANAGAGKRGGQQGDTIVVVATGIGQDSDSALKNALRAAVEQAVGTLVDSETLAENDEIVSDQILSYSGGFVESHKVVGEPKTRDGLVTVKISAVVKRTQLAEKLQAANVHVKEVDGESLFGEVFTALEQEQNASELLKKKFEGFPENLLGIKLAGKPAYNRETKKIQIPVEIAINRQKYRDFARDLVATLTKVASSHQTVNQNSTPWESGVSFDILNSEGVIAICAQINDARTNSKWEVFNASKEIMAALFTAFRRPAFTVDILDSDGDSIVSGRYNCPVPYGLWHLDRKRGVYIIPLLGHSVTNTITPGTVSGKWTLDFDVSTEEMKRMRNVVCKIEKG
jgi:hypothetical protein